ncbi:MAG: hypothetical protein ABH824_04020, partial [Nanoarchaeota archaeon]
DRSVLKNTSKKAMVLIMREVIRNLGINIIVQETTQKFVRKYLRQDLKKHNYKLYSFFLDIDLENAIKRDIQREKPTMGLGKIKTREEWEKAKAQPDKEDIVIHTGKHKIKEVVDIILSETKEKRRKNPNAHLVRKCY